MIECLSNPAWINPQIDFLLFIQKIRMAHFEAFDKLFLSITIFGEHWLPTLICAIAYWCIDIKAGLYLFSLEGVNIIFTHNKVPPMLIFLTDIHLYLNKYL